MQIKKKQVMQRRMRRIRCTAEIQAEKVKRLKRELWLTHKRSRTESGEMGIVWWNRDDWDVSLGINKLGMKKEELLTLSLQIKVKLLPTPQLTYPPSCTSTSQFHSIDPNDFVWSPVYTPSPF